MGPNRTAQESRAKKAPNAHPCVSPALVTLPILSGTRAGLSEPARTPPSLYRLTKIGLPTPASPLPHARATYTTRPRVSQPRPRRGQKKTALKSKAFL